MPKPPLNQINNDPYLKGAIHHGSSLPCGNCHTETQLLVKLKEVTLPEGLKPTNSMIAYQYPGDPDSDLNPVHYLGISCGCYAKFHRQITHILDKKK